MSDQGTFAELYWGYTSAFNCCLTQPWLEIQLSFEKGGVYANVLTIVTRTQLIALRFSAGWPHRESVRHCQVTS